jgi:hypothetical protein
VPHSRLGDVVGVVEPDPEKLARQHRGQQPNLLERVPRGRVVAIGDEPVLDDAVARPGARVEAAEPHDEAPGISTGVCAGA